MNNVFSKTSNVWLAAMALLPLSACSDLSENESAPEIGPTGSAGVIFRIPGITGLNGQEGAEQLADVSVFHFKGEDFLMRTDIEDPYAETIGLPTNGTTRVYCVSGIPMEAAEGTKEEDFRNITVSCDAKSTHSPLFYAGVADFSEENLSQGRLEIEMKRGIARIDFMNTVDPEIIVNKLIVEDAPGATFVFPCDSMPEAGKITFTHVFDEPFFGEEPEVFTLFESTEPIHVRILGEYQDTPINVRTTLPSIERNKIYKLQITNINSNVAGAFTCKDWEEGNKVGAIPSTTNIMLDKVNSIVPEGVEVDYGKNLVTVPFEGVKDMKLAFLADTKVSLASVEGGISDVKISANDPVKVEEGYISTFNVTVDANKRLGYSVMLNVKDARGRGNFVEIKVLDDKTLKIETVEMAGCTWMAFNCAGPELSDQVYPVDGLSVEETYISNWLAATGCLYQFGRQYSYVPYLSYRPSNNLGNQAQDLPRWATESHMPCPEGYHVATIEELRTLWPNGTEIPGTYTAGNGERITVTVHESDLPIETPTKVGGKIRYMKFKSNDTGNELIFPLAGYKGDKSTASNPYYGRDAVYWTNSNMSCPGGHARAYRFMFNWGESCKMDEFQWPMEAFAYVRAVKNVESNEE